MNLLTDVFRLLLSIAIAFLGGKVQFTRDYTG